MLLFLQPNQRPEVCSGIRVRLQITAPGSRQFKHADGVTGWRGIKYDMVIFFPQLMIGQQTGKLIKRSDFRGA